VRREKRPIILGSKQEGGEGEAAALRRGAAQLRDRTSMRNGLVMTGVEEGEFKKGCPWRRTTEARSDPLKEGGKGGKLDCDRKSQVKKSKRRTPVLTIVLYSVLKRANPVCAREKRIYAR